jgi:hypothetical protein
MPLSIGRHQSKFRTCTALSVSKDCCQTFTKAWNVSQAPAEARILSAPRLLRCNVVNLGKNFYSVVEQAKYIQMDHLLLDC